MTQTHIWWIRRDVRLQDNQALEAAQNSTNRLIPLFILEPDLLSKAAPKRRAFLLQALADLDQSLQKLGSRLVLRHGPALGAFQQLADDLGSIRVFSQEDFSPYARRRDQAVANRFDLSRHPGTVLRHPEEITKTDGLPYSVFTPYKNAWYGHLLPTPAHILPAPEHLPPLPDGLQTARIPAFNPVQSFPGTAVEAQQRLDDFITEGIQHYRSRRDRLDLDGTSRLSPYLRFGLVSIREAFTRAAITELGPRDGDTRKEIRTWMDELVWREFYTMILYHHPHVMYGAYRPEYQRIPWRDAQDDLRAWQAGETGYPVVDACMRQLNQMGWMHNRGRMITASFLTKDLLINWQEGEDWFMRNLVDGDPAANNGGWQWSAGTGTDAAPYFRIFNPVLQGLKFDPEGEFIAQWVPELAHLPVKYRHQPWELSAAEAQKFGFQIGRDYPERIVDHTFARERTLAAYKSSRMQEADKAGT